MKTCVLRCLPGLALCLLVLTASSAKAEGTLTHLSGVVSVHKLDGNTLVGAVGIKVLAGDTLFTGTGGYARMEMSDGGEMVLRPDSQLKVESYNYAVAKPEKDNFVFRMLKGGLRTVSGLIGKRGNRDAYQLNTATATIGIRGTQFDLRVCEGSCGALADGTYLVVRFGAVHASNPHGSLAVGVGQVAHVPPQQAPVMLPRDPGIGFTPPAVIPKLDEKKKVQAAAATAAVTPAQTSGSGQSTTSVPRSGEAASASVGTENSGANTESNRHETVEKSTEATAGNAAPGLPVEGRTISVTEISLVPLNSEPAAGVDCSVQ